MIEEKVICPLCECEVGKQNFYNHFRAEKYVLDMISQSHPDWKEEDGTCTKCMEFYKALGQ